MDYSKKCCKIVDSLVSKMGFWEVDLWSLQPGFPCIPKRCCVSWQQDADNGMLSLAERFTNKLEQPRFTWLPHYLAKAINLCGQACKAGLSVQIAHNQEVCVQLCICPSRTWQSLDSGIMNGSCLSHLFSAVYMTW